MNNEQKFWAIISSMGWGRTYDTDAIGKKSMAIEDGFKKDFLAILDAKRAVLMSTYLELDGSLYQAWIGESDDGLDDLVCHVVGLGEVVYNACLADYKEMSKYSYDGQNSGEECARVENFFYSFFDLREAIGEQISNV